MNGDGGGRPRGAGRRRVAALAGSGIPIALSRKNSSRETAKGTERVRVAVTITLREPRAAAFDRLVLWLQIDLETATGWERGHKQLLDQLSPWLERMESPIRRATAPLVHARLAEVMPCRDAVIEALARREAEMQGYLPSTARQLVQAGLFDRRAMRAAATRAGAVDVLEDDWAARRQELKRSGAPIDIGCAVSAVLLERR